MTGIVLGHIYNYGLENISEDIFQESNFFRN